MQAHLETVQGRLAACHENLLPGLASADVSDICKAAEALTLHLDDLEVRIPPQTRSVRTQQDLKLMNLALQQPNTPWKLLAPAQSWPDPAAACAFCM